MSQASSISNFSSDEEELRKTIKRTAEKNGVKYDRVWYRNECPTSEPHPFYGCAYARERCNMELGQGTEWFVWEKRTRSGTKGEMVKIEEEFIDRTEFDEVITEAEVTSMEIVDLSDDESTGSRTPTQASAGKQIAFNEGHDDIRFESSPEPSEEEGKRVMEEDMKLHGREEELWSALAKAKTTRLEREAKTINIVKETENKKEVKGGDEDVEMEDEWMDEINEEEWKVMIKEVCDEARKKGKKVGGGEEDREVRKALEAEVNKRKVEGEVKRKRGEKDVGGREREGARSGANTRIICNTKRAIIKTVATGMLASKYANAGPTASDNKGKGREPLRARTPEKGEPSKVKKTMEERMEAMENKVYRIRSDLSEAEKAIRFWRGRCEELERIVRPGRQVSVPEIRQPPRAGPNHFRIPPALPLPPRREIVATRSNLTPINDARAAKEEPTGKGWTLVSREESNKAKAKEAYQKSMVKAQKEKEEKNKGVIVIDRQPIKEKGAKMSEEERKKVVVSESELKEIATGMGIKENEIASIGTTWKGNLKITLAKDEDKKTTIEKLAARNIQVRTMDRWAGIVVHGWMVNEWKDKMEDIKVLLEKAWGVKLMKAPKWLADLKNMKPDGRPQAVVVHVAKASDRETILKSKYFRTVDESGYLVTQQQIGFALWMREFTQNGMSTQVIKCTECLQSGHRWWQCRNEKICGECQCKGHTTWDHKVRGIRGNKPTAPRRKSTNVMQNLMEDGRKADIIAIQEPWIGKKRAKNKKIGNEVEVGNGQITVGHNGYDIVYKQGKGEEKARVMWMVRKDSGLKWTIRDDLWDHWDTSILDIKLTDERTLRIVNIYNQEHSKREGWCMKAWPHGLSERVDLMVVGDFNAHGALWNSKKESMREEMVMDMVESEELVLLNEIDRITRKRGSEESVLDLTWVGENMERKCNWRIIEDADTGSDHATIEISYLQQAERILNPLGKRWNLKKADWKEVQGEADRLVDEKELTWEEAIERKDVEKIASILEEIVTKAMVKGIPKARMSWKSKNWYDKEVREERKTVSKCRRWAKQKTRWKEKEEAEWKNQRNKMFKLIRRKKKEMWNNWIGEAKNPKEMWAIWRMLNNRIYTKMPTLKDNNGNCNISTFTEKEVLLREKLFPPAPERDQERDKPGRERGMVDEVTRGEVERAIESQGNQKAPGPDGVPIEVLKKLDNKFRERLKEGLNLMVQQGRHPELWRKAIGAIIPKPGKGDYTTPRSYRPISLLNTMGKVLEKIVAERITKHVEENEGLHKWQWGGRRERGAEECVEWTLDWAREKRKMGKKVAIIAADIDQAFPNVARIRLGNKLRKNKLNEELVEWVEEFMKNRKIKLRFDGREAEWQTVETGIPQGSPISPLLFNVYIAPLLQHMESFISEKFEDDSIVPTFIDDVTFVVAGDTWEEVIGRGEEMLKEANAWAKKNDIKFAEDKLEWIRLGEKKEFEEKESIESGGGGSKEECDVMRWLGVWIDRELKFKEHVEIKVRKAEAVTQRIGRLARGEEGCGVGNLRKMYIACARSVMEFGSRVWWGGQKGMAGKLDKANEKAMRKIGGHLRSAPGGAIRVENNMVPTEFRFNERQQRIAVKAISKNRKHPMRKLAEQEIKQQKEEKRCNDREWGKGGEREKYKKGEKKGGVRRGCKRVGERTKGNWKKIEKSWEQEKKEKEWEREVREELEIEIGRGEKEGLERMKRRREEEDEVIMYTDGSKRGDKVGVGVCRFDRWGGKVWTGSYGLGSEMEIMDAEMVGIKKAVEEGRTQCQEKGVSKLVIRTDSQGAMMRVKERKPGPGEMMAYKIRWQIHAAKVAGIITKFEWVKAHANIAGNEAADILAKEGCNKPKDREWFISLAYLTTKAKSEVEQLWTEQWQTDPRKGSSYLGTPNERNKVHFEDHDRSTKVIISRLRTGHIWINKYRFKIKQAENEQCECGQGVQDVEHILEKCRFTVDSRAEAEEKLEKAVGMRELLYTNEGIEYAVKIWREFKIVRKSANEEGEREDRELEWGMGDLEN